MPQITATHVHLDPREGYRPTVRVNLELNSVRIEAPPEQGGELVVFVGLDTDPALARAELARDLAEAFRGIAAAAFREAGRAPSIVDITPFRDHGTRSDESPTYRRDMTEAGRGRLLR